jgi:hypothetical protein
MGYDLDPAAAMAAERRERAAAVGCPVVHADRDGLRADLPVGYRPPTRVERLPLRRTCEPRR